MESWVLHHRTALDIWIHVWLTGQYYSKCNRHYEPWYIMSRVFVSVQTLSIVFTDFILKFVQTGLDTVGLAV